MGDDEGSSVHGGEKPEWWFLHKPLKASAIMTPFRSSLMKLRPCKVRQDLELNSFDWVGPSFVCAIGEEVVVEPRPRQE